jgi:DNA (cytosine-5)-methyltransferase 1
MEKINLLDLFSGIGGFHLGLKKAGFQFDKVFNSDIDKYANAVYKYNFNESLNVGSVTDVRGSDLPKINAITFGSPCQDFSLAGSRAGLEGDRSSLISEAIRLIDECRPDFFIWENVKGTFSSNNGEDFWAIIQAFTNIGGYRLEWQLLNTRWFLPQNRERIYLVGCLGEKSKSEVFPIEKNGRINNKRLNLISDSIQPILTPNRLKKNQNGRRFKEAGEDMFTLTKQDQNGIMIKEATKKGYSVAEVGDSINYSVPVLKTRRDRVGKKTAQTLDTACNQEVIESGTLRTHNDGRGFRKIKNGDVPAIPARARNDGSGQPIIKEKAKIRRLTPIECERLQGFPDNWTKIGIDGPISDTQRYKMCGNAVTVDVVQAVGEKLYNN